MRYVLWYAMIGVILAVLANSMFFWSADRRTPASAEKVNLPSANSDIEKRLANAINFERIAQTQTTGGSGGPSKQDEDLASAIASKMKNYPAEYNKPGTLHLNESTQIELVIKTNDKQDTAPLFQNLEGEITKATVLVANDISAQLSGPPDRLQITLRGDKMRTILSPAPVTWIWDVKPLKPGKAQVTLEVTSYIKNGRDKEPVPIRVLQDTWLVDAQGLEWLTYRIAQIEPIQAFLGGLVGAVFAVLAWFGVKGWRGGKTDFET